MADEEKVEVTEAEGAEATEEKKDNKKEKKEKKSVDVGALVNKAKDGVGAGSDKVTSIVKEADNKKKMMIFLAIIIFEVVLSVLGGVGAIFLIFEIVVAAVGFIGLKAAFGEDKADGDETAAE